MIKLQPELIAIAELLTVTESNDGLYVLDRATIEKAIADHAAGRSNTLNESQYKGLVRLRSYAFKSPDGKICWRRVG